MKCWKCSSELAKGVATCVYCGTDQRRKPVSSEIGRAMRMLYDRYGAQAVLANSAYLINGLSDLTEDSKKLRNRLKMAMDAGLGRLYQDQLQAGDPDSAFDEQVRRLLTEDAGLSDKVAAEISGYFDEMIGWRQMSRSKSVGGAVPRNSTNPVNTYTGADSAEIRKESLAVRDGKSYYFEDKSQYGNNEESGIPKKSFLKNPIFLIIAGLVFACVFLVFFQYVYNRIHNGQSDTFQAEATTSKSEMTTPATEKTTSYSEWIEESKKAQKEEEQIKLKATFESMSDYRGSLKENDFLFFNNSVYNELGTSQYVFLFYPESGGMTARGLKIGDSKERAVTLYGNPGRKFSADSNWVIYRLIKNFEQDDELAAKLNKNTVYEYTFHDVNNTFATKYRDSDSVLLDLVFDQNTGKFCGYAWENR